MRGLLAFPNSVSRTSS